ncbi:hypothetical protein N0V90_007922 [Kalmusia sp. IMI 367209]|nr:hypothetical protein N0V90_007922 [Kalmusia sp. IMI 367209]
MKDCHLPDSAAAVSCLVLAIGSQDIDKTKSDAWFRRGLDVLLADMTNNMNVSTVQGFTLVALFMLRAFQPNGAYLYFSLAARTAYAIGIHRTEVNASFGVSTKTTRDRIWKSLRVVDMLISCVLGRPTSTSDVDCTVKYAVSDTNRPMSVNVMDASLQIFLIIERVVVEVYSRKRISLRIADYVSRQFKTWASTWMQPLSEVAVGSSINVQQASIVGACSTLCSYYYGIMLLTRPFLIYELYEHMGTALRGHGSKAEHHRKRLYADAALDAALSFVDTLQAVIKLGVMPNRMPLIVSWLSTASLVLAISSLGRSGLAFEDTCKASINCLDYFGDVDPHASQYSHTVRSILEITTSFVRKREQQAVLKRRHASSELFGLLPPEVVTNNCDIEVRDSYIATPQVASHSSEQEAASITTSDWTIYDADFFALPWPVNEYDQGLQDFLQPGTHNLDGATIADIPLFPIFDQQTASTHSQV